MARMSDEKDAQWLLNWCDFRWWRCEQMKEDSFRHLDRDGNRSKWEAALVRYVGKIGRKLP